MSGLDGADPDEVDLDDEDRLMIGAIAVLMRRHDASLDDACDYFFNCALSLGTPASALAGLVMGSVPPRVGRSV